MRVFIEKRRAGQKEFTPISEDFGDDMKRARQQMEDRQQEDVDRGLTAAMKIQYRIVDNRTDVTCFEYGAAL